MENLDLIIGTAILFFIFFLLIKYSEYKHKQ